MEEIKAEDIKVQESSPQKQVEEGDDAVESTTAPNPDGFFADLTDSEACSVAVALRVRPLVGRELTEGNRKLCIQQPATNSRTKLLVGPKSFAFDSVFWAEDKQEYIFDTCARNLVLGCFHGFNATILAYGQTGSGKTHTMGTGGTIGIPFDEVGIVPRVFKFIFDELEMRKAQAEYSEFKVSIAFLELYNEELHDLLDPAGMVRDRATGKPMKELTIREEKNGVISVRGLSETVISSQEECMHHLHRGIQHRQTSATLMNEGSSRSHAIFTVTIEQKIVKDVDDEVAAPAGKGAGAKPAGDEEKAQVTEEISSKFHFVDLAGSERIKKTGATGQLLKEGISINKGLLCLGQVISALTDDARKKEHIPYRDSKLTRILQDSLGGNSRTTMIACVSPAESNYDESLSTVKYASRARNIKNKPVVNRDPNSMLIESLRAQIQQLQFEVKEYAVIMEQSGVAMPTDLSQKLLERQKAKDQANLQKAKTAPPPSASSGGANPQEVKDLKIKVSHQQKEIRELKQKLQDQQVFLDQKDKQLKEVEKERDLLALKSESMAEQLKSNNIEFDSKQFDQKGGAASAETAQKAGLIEQYKTKLAKAQKDLDQKIREMQEKDQNYWKLKQSADRNEKILKKTMDENQALKRGSGSALGSSRATSASSANSGIPVKRDFKTMRAQRKAEATKSIEEFNEKFMTDLQGQIDDMFTNIANRKLRDESESSPEKDAKDGVDEESQAKGDEDKIDGEPNGSSQAVVDKDAQEKEKLLEMVRQQALSMQSDIKDLLKNEWAGSIKSLENEKKKAENDRQENLKKAKDDSKAVQAIEKEHRQKMESLNGQVQKLEREKQKKEEAVAKQIAMQEARIKALENDLEKQKKKREEVERQKKFDEDRFFKFKTNVNKDLQTEKKKASEKDKQMSKLKNELKRVDQLAQQKISQLRGLQKRAQEEKEKRDIMEQREQEAKGIDIDLIKAWITSNTDAMLKNQELKEYLEKQLAQKDKVETEMLEEGDRMTELLVMREKLEMEREELEGLPDDQKDEGRILEIDDQLKDISLEIGSITETLDMLEETLEFVQSKVNQVTEEVEGFDLDSVQPMSFNALDSIESAKATLKTFFQVVLDLNIYKRDLEQKCIDQDENVIQLQAKVQQEQARVQYMIEHGGTDGYAAQVSKQAAISNVLKHSIDGFVDNRDVEHLNLNAAEQTNLTKLSLSKIVNNLKNKLREQESKTQSVTLKLDQALKQKEIYKSRCDELKSQQKNTAAPRNRAYQAVGSKLTSHEQQNNYGRQAEGDGDGGRQRGLSFKDRQRQKKEKAQAKPVVSLADRRKNRTGNILEQDNFSNELDKLKQNAENMELERQNKEAGAGVQNLEDILEGEEDDEDEPIRKKSVNLSAIKEQDVEEAASLRASGQKQGAGSVMDFRGYQDGFDGQTASAVGISQGQVLEPDQNFSQFMNEKKMMEQENQVENEEWAVEHFIDLVIGTGFKLVDFYFLDTKMICFFENFQVQEIDLRTKEIEKNYNLQEIEGFEISEDAEEDRVVATAFEKDVQLLGVACVDTVHIFEYVEENETSLAHVTKIQQANISQLVFVEYILTMVQEQEATSSNIKILCFDLESEDIKGTTQIEKTSSSSKVIIQPGDECLFFVAGAQIGKIEVPTMTEVFKIHSGHTDEILDMTVSTLGQLITTSRDGSIRFFSSVTGQSVSDPMEGMECDHLASRGINLLTRVGDAAERTMLVWRIQPNGGVGEEPVNEVEFGEEDRLLADKALSFTMKCGVMANAEKDGQDAEQLVMMYASMDYVNFKLLSQKLRKF